MRKKKKKSAAVVVHKKKEIQLSPTFDFLKEEYDPVRKVFFMPSGNRPTQGVGAVAKFQFIPDEYNIETYMTLINQGKTHDEAIEILKRDSLKK